MVSSRSWWAALAGVWRRLVVALARRTPLESPGACAAFSGIFLGTALSLMPGLRALAHFCPLVSEALDGTQFGWPALRIAGWSMTAAAWLGFGFFQARCLQICHPDFYDRYAGGSAGGEGPARPRPGGVAVAGMPIEAEDLRASVLVTGVTGSSKTAGVLLPLLAQLLEAYSRETGDDERSEDPFQKLGAFIPEVKGDLVDACIYLAHEAGRCVSRDFVILTPSCRIPVLRCRDERGRSWFLGGRGGAGGSDAGDFLASLRLPAGHPQAGSPVSPSLLDLPEDFAALLPELSKTALAAPPWPRFIGWRREGDRLLRVGPTRERDRPLALRDGEGRLQWADPPRTLRVDGLFAIDNGLRYNLVDQRLPAGEAAERLTRLAAMARGGASRGENDYFYEQGRKVIAACISLHRAVEAAPCTAADVVRLATQDARLEAALAALSGRIEKLRSEADAAPDPEVAADLRRLRIAPLEDLRSFFCDEWQKMVGDGKTANVIKSTISATFDPFLRDPYLAETFCQPSTFSFEDVVQRGRIVALVPGDRYEQLGRLLGTACKMDFQSTMLSRNGRPDLNSARLALYFADECHKYAISGSSSAGDPYFMNLSRSNRVVNLCATQSYAWIVEVIGREAANVYISAFGVQFWLQQTDPETCRRAAEICGRVTREKVVAEHDFSFAGWLAALGGGKELSIRHRVRSEERERFRPEDFALLDVGEIIVYNKGRKGRLAKVVKGRASYLSCTHPPAGPAAVNARVREYHRELLENLAHERGQDARWNCGPGTEAADPPAGEEEGSPPAEADGAEALCRRSIARERTEFASRLGGLDAAVARLSGAWPGDLAADLEEAGRAEAGPASSDAGFHRLLAAGLGGLAAGADAPPLSLPPGAWTAAYGPDLVSPLADRAARGQAESRAAARRRTGRPRPDPAACRGKVVRDLAA